MGEGKTLPHKYFSSLSFIISHRDMSPKGLRYPEGTCGWAWTMLRSRKNSKPEKCGSKCFTFRTIFHSEITFQFRCAYRLTLLLIGGRVVDRRIILLMTNDVMRNIWFFEICNFILGQLNGQCVDRFFQMRNFRRSDNWRCHWLFL